MQKKDKKNLWVAGGVLAVLLAVGFVGSSGVLEQNLASQSSDDQLASAVKALESAAEAVEKAAATAELSKYEAQKLEEITKESVAKMTTATDDVKTPVTLDNSTAYYNTPYWQEFDDGDVWCISDNADGSVNHLPDSDCESSSSVGSASTQPNIDGPSSDVTYCFSVSACDLLQEVCEGTGNTYSDPEDGFGGCFTNGLVANSSVDDSLPIGTINFTTQEGKKLAQTILNLEGMYDSAIDGKFGTGSQAALRTWQIAQNLAPTGILDSATMKAMNNYVLKRLAYFAKMSSGDDELPTASPNRQVITCKQESWPHASFTGSLPNPPQWPVGDFEVTNGRGKVLAGCTIAASS